MSGISDEDSNSLEGQIEAHKKLKWKNIELRSIEGIPVDSLSSQAINKVVKSLKKNGLNLNCIASRIGNWERTVNFPLKQEVEELKVLAELGSKASCKFIRVMSYKNDSESDEKWRDESLNRLYKLSIEASSLGMVLLHENCSGWAGQGPNQTIEMLNTIDSPSLGLLFDIGNGLTYDYDSVDILKSILPWIHHVHIKDGISGNEGVIYCFPGNGEAKVKSCIKYLLKNNYNGLFSIEPHVNLIPHLKVKAPNQVNKIRNNKINLSVC